PGQQPDVFVTRFDFTGARPNIELDNPYKIDPGHQQAIIVGDNDSGVEFGYRLAYEDAQPLKRIDLELGDCMAAGQQAVIVVAGIGNYEGLSLTGTAVDHYARTPINVAQVESPEALLASQEPGYVVDEVGDLWVKLVSQAMGAPLVTTRVRWD
ncbi:MAG: hypothetical protein VX834_02060, partial [Myxococcota bacterium]|nr:hypothetical protein [Myxococcota bacterium]